MRIKLKKVYLRYRLKKKGYKFLKLSRNYVIGVNKDGIYTIWMLCNFRLITIGNYLSKDRAKFTLGVILNHGGKLCV